MAIADLWYTNAIIYCLDVEKYQDANGDGVGDFEGLMRRLDYLQGLGVTCVWLQPFYPSPNRDNGYDVVDFFGVAIRYDWRNTSLLTLHNFSSAKQTVKIKVDTAHDGLLVEVFDGHHSKAQNDGLHRLAIDPHAWRWYRVGGPDNALERSDLDLTNPRR